MKFGFIIDTNKYSGNFEREMTAYVTGQIGECGVGEEEAALFMKETKRTEGLDFIEKRPTGDSAICYRPTEICPTPGFFNHGHGGNFKEGEEEKALIHYRKEVAKYNKDIIKRAKTSNWKQSDIDSEVKRCQKEIDEANALKKPHKYYAYQSVMIFCDRKPTDEEISFMKERAQSFAKKEKIKISGFRLSKTTSKESLEEV